jgi:hypothetical protein
VNVGRDLISRVTDAVMDDVRDWAKRPLEDVYPVVFLDCMVLKIREGGSVQRRACYLALGITLDGERDVLGMWLKETEGAKFWMQVLPDLKQRGVQDILICCVDGLEGLPRGDRGDLPQDHGPNLHRSPHSPELEVTCRGASVSRSPGASSRSTPPPGPTPRRPSSSASTRSGVF